MVVTLNVLYDIFKADRSGKQVLIKKDVEYKKMFETNGLLAEHFSSKNGVVSKKYCMVKEGDAHFKLNHKFEDIEKLIKPVKIRGFK